MVFNLFGFIGVFCHDRGSGTRKSASRTARIFSAVDLCVVGSGWGWAAHQSWLSSHSIHNINVGCAAPAEGGAQDAFPAPCIWCSSFLSATGGGKVELQMFLHLTAALHFCIASFCGPWHSSEPPKAARSSGFMLKPPCFQSTETLEKDFDSPAFQWQE